jgi:catechol-2,3-dioxygenase
MDDFHMTTPTLRQVVLDCEDARALAEFYRQLLGFQSGLVGAERRQWLSAPGVPASAALTGAHLA